MRQGIRFFLLASSLLLTEGCKTHEPLDDLADLKQYFLETVCASEERKEAPFDFHYRIRTVFSSQEIISLFGELHSYTGLPHGWSRYEGKTLCKIDGHFREITLERLFETPEQKEFLRGYCEKALKAQEFSYFSGSHPLRTGLEWDDIRNYVIDDSCLRVIFQPYAVGDWADGPFIVEVPIQELSGRWNSSNPVAFALEKALSSNSYIASWQEKLSEDT